MVQLSKEEIKRVLENNHRSESIDKLFELFAQHLNDRLKEKDSEIAELKEQLESKKDECNEYAANCNKYHDLYLSKDGENKQLRVTMAHQDSQSAQYSRMYSDLLKQKDDEIAKLQSTISEQQERIRELEKGNQEVINKIIAKINWNMEQERWVMDNPKGYEAGDIRQCIMVVNTSNNIIDIINKTFVPESLTKKQD